MFTTILIAAVIAGYCFWIIRKKYRDVKNGKFCGCGCEGCSGKCEKFSSTSQM